MKKTTVVDVAQSLTAKNEVHRKLDVISAEVRKTASLLEGKKRELQSAIRSLDDFKKNIAEQQGSRTIDLTSGPSYSWNFAHKFHEDKLSAQEQNDYEIRKGNISTAEAEVDSATKRLEALKDEDQTFFAELFKNGEELEETLLFQKSLAETLQKITAISNAISTQKTIIENATVDISSIDALSREREDLLADIAIGNAKDSALAAFDKRIDVTKGKVFASQGEAKAAKELAQQTIEGLQRKLSSLEGELNVLEGQKKNVLTRFITAEAEKVGVEYGRLAEELVAKFRQLNALDNLLTEVGSQSIAIGDLYDFMIPCFNIRTHETERTVGWYFDNTSILASLQAVNLEAADLTAEKERISSMGISI